MVSRKKSSASDQRQSSDELNIFIFRRPRNDYTRMALWITNYWTWKKWDFENYLWLKKRIHSLQTITSRFKISKSQNCWILFCRWFKILGRIPNRGDQDYFYSYKHSYKHDFLKIPLYQQFWNIISRCLYFITEPKFVVPILGIVRATWKSSCSKLRIGKMRVF